MRFFFQAFRDRLGPGIRVLIMRSKFKAPAQSLEFWSLGFRVWSLGFRVWGLGFGVWGLWFRASSLGM